MGLYAPADLNVIDGSSIWLESAASTLAMLGGAQLRLLLRAPVRRDLVTRRLERPNIRLVRSGAPVGDTSGRLQDVEALEALEREDDRERFDLVVLRGYAICRLAARRGRFAGRLIAAYVLEPERDPADPDHRRGLQEIVAASAALAVQTTEMGELLGSVAPAALPRLVLLPPGVPADLLSGASWARDDRLYYIGKFHPFYAVDRIIQAAARLRQRMPNLVLEVAGDKMPTQEAGRDARTRLEVLLATTPGVVWHGALDRGSVHRMLQSGGVAVSVWDYAHGPRLNDLVVSTKLLDYAAAGLPAAITPTSILRRLLGADYPGFVDSVDELPTTLDLMLGDPELRAESARRLVLLARRFTYDSIATELEASLAALGLLPARGATA